jgi:ATP-dependent Clp protease adaptor protein ClpS
MVAYDRESSANGPAAGLWAPLAARLSGTHIDFVDPIRWTDAGRERRSGVLPRARQRPSGSCRGRPSNPAGTSNTQAMLQTSSDIQLRRSPSSVLPSPVAMANDEGRSGAPNTSVITKVKPKTKRPSLYRVLILNDDYTPMEFVVHVLEKFFQKDVEAATQIMLHVHHHGIGECGIFTYEIAETKVTQVMDFARKHQHPLQCVMEKK